MARSLFMETCISETTQYVKFDGFGGESYEPTKVATDRPSVTDTPFFLVRR
jgi:hypothetical protein